MDVDPIASFRIWAIELNMGGRVFEIPALPAADWLPLLMEGDATMVLDLVEDPTLDDMILSGEIEANELADAVSMAVEQAAGRSLHQATVLAQAARVQWTVFGGDLARRGFRWDEVSLGAALDAIHATVLAHLKPDAVKRFEALLGQAPESIKAGPGKIRMDRRKALAQHEEMAGPRPTAVASTPGTSTVAPSGGGPPRIRQRPRQRPRAGR